MIFFFLGGVMFFENYGDATLCFVWGGHVGFLREMGKSCYVLREGCHGIFEEKQGHHAGHVI